MLNATEIAKIVTVLTQNASIRQSLAERYIDIANTLQEPITFALIKGNKLTYSTIIDSTLYSIFKDALIQTDELKGCQIGTFFELNIASERKNILTKMITSDNRKVENLFETVKKECGLVPADISLQSITTALQSFNSASLVPEPLDNETINEEEIETITEEQENLNIGEDQVQIVVPGETQLPPETTENVNDFKVTSDTDGPVSMCGIQKEEYETLDNTIDEEEISDISSDFMDNYNNISQETEKNDGLVKDISQTGKEEMFDDSEVDTKDFSFSLQSTIQALLVSIMLKNEMVYKSCFELDRPQAVLYGKGLLTHKVDEQGNVSYIESSGGKDDLFVQLYEALTKDYKHLIKSAPYARNVPNVPNFEKGINYYPGLVYNYAFGSVGNREIETSWEKFNENLKKDLTNRLSNLAKKDEATFKKYATKMLQSAFTNAILLTDFNPSAGMKFRMCIMGAKLDRDRLLENIKSIPVYNSAEIIISKVTENCDDVVDVQILTNPDMYYDTPSFAYKAMELKLKQLQGKPLNIFKEGIPIGRKLNGDIVYFKFDTTENFCNVISAGSRSGKGVLTLSILAAALGAGLPVYYFDKKPDMAKMLWDVENAQNIDMFAFDSATKKRKMAASGLEYTMGENVPFEAREFMATHLTAISYIKYLMFMCEMAKTKIEHHVERSDLFVFDEVQTIHKKITALVKALNIEIMDTKEKGRKANPKLHNYYLKLAEFIIETNAAFGDYLTTTGGLSSTFTFFICQNADAKTWTPNGTLLKTPIDILPQAVVRQGTMKKLIGRGNEASPYGISPLKGTTEANMISKHRFFAMYTSNSCPGLEGTTVFKPFLTLNSDDVLEECWVKGLGRAFGSDTLPKLEYVTKVARKYPGSDANTTNRQGVHIGVGFLGLASMYCNYDKNKLNTNLQLSMRNANEFIQTTAFNNKYRNAMEYLYDFSIDGFKTLTNWENGAVCESDESDNEISATTSEYNSGINLGGVAPQVTLPQQTNQTSKSNILETTENKMLNNFNIFNKPTSQPLSQQNEYEQKSYQSEQDLSNALRNVRDYTTNNVQETQQNIQQAEDIEETSNNIPTYNPLNEKVTVAVRDTASINYENGGRTIIYDSNQITNGIALTPENSIDCTKIKDSPLNWTEKIATKSLSGSISQDERIWRSIINTILDDVYSAVNITKVSLLGDDIFINGKIANTNGLFGGIEGRTLKNVVDFKYMFKKFPYIKELKIDKMILRAMMLEYNNEAQIFEKVFKDNKKLKYIKLQNEDGSVTTIDRLNANQNIAKEIVKETQVRNTIEAHCKGKTFRGFGKNKIDEDVWTYKLAKSMGTNTINAAKGDDASIIKTLGWGIGTTAMFAITGAYDFVARLFGGWHLDLQKDN